MKQLTTFLLSGLLTTGSVFAQQGVTQCGTPTNQSPFPIQTYQELQDPSAPIAEQWAVVKQPAVSWGSTDARYAKHSTPTLKVQKAITLEGWRGEKLHAQAVVWTGTDVDKLN